MQKKPIPSPLVHKLRVFFGIVVDQPQMSLVLVVGYPKRTLTFYPEGSVRLCPFLVAT
jgi:hypothetical protein